MVEVTTGLTREQRGLADKLTRAHLEFVRGQRAAIERRELIVQLWEAGVTQTEIASMLTAAQAGQKGATDVTTNAVQKVVEKFYTARRRKESAA